MTDEATKILRELVEARDQYLHGAYQPENERVHRAMKTARAYLAVQPAAAPPCPHHFAVRSEDGQSWTECVYCGRPRKRCNTCGQPMPQNETAEHYAERTGYLLRESALRDPPTAGSADAPLGRLDPIK